MNERSFFVPNGYHLNSSIYSNISVPAGTWWASINTSEVKCDSFSPFWLLLVYNVYLSSWDLPRCHSDRPRVTGIHDSPILLGFNPSNIQGRVGRQEQLAQRPHYKPPAVKPRRSKLAEADGLFIYYIFFWCLSMKAIVSKSSTCQERNCPLYLVATFTVEVHSDSCFLSPGWNTYLF